MIISLEFDAKKLLNAIDKFPKQVLRNTQLALKMGCRDIQERARKVHPGYTSRSGNLDRSITTQVDVDRLIGAVGIDKGIAKYGLAIHDGSKPHIIRIKRKKSLRWVGRSGRFRFAKQVRHPGTKPVKNINKAAEVEEKRINERFFKGIQKAAQGVFV